MRILIDALTPGEVRAGVLNKNAELIEYLFEDSLSDQVKGSIFLGQVERVEPSLQAAFINYGAEKNGFLPFREVHPDYFRIPVADRSFEKPKPKKEEFSLSFSGDVGSTSLEVYETDDTEIRKAREGSRAHEFYKKYKIQEILHPKQVILVQIVKEQRSSKGAALTTFITLSGRYCVFLPNTIAGGGVSRRIRDPQVREKMQEAVDALECEEGSAVLVRTAADSKPKQLIKRDYLYLKKTWDAVRQEVVKAKAPVLIRREMNAAMRAVRDLWTDEVESVIIDGEDQYKEVVKFLRGYAPKQVQKVNLYEEKKPLFEKYSVDFQIESLFEPTVYLPSGGYIVINQTEALISIDVNSGRATKERHIDETALKTNLDAVCEIGRQVRLRDLSGLLVVDFIDMADAKGRQKVEEAMHAVMQSDRARVQIGKISQFGLMEMSRQRLGFSSIDKMMEVCERCSGFGYVKRSDFLAKQVLRSAERVLLYNKVFGLQICVTVPVLEEISSTYSNMLERIKKAYQVPIRFHVTHHGQEMSICVRDQSGTVLWCESIVKNNDSGEKESVDTTNSKRR